MIQSSSKTYKYFLLPCILKNVKYKVVIYDMSTYANRVFSISDLLKHIGKFKHEFESASDREKINDNFDFQHILFHIFHNKFDTGIIMKDNTDRLKMKVCFCNPQYIDIIFDCFEKYQRIPYYSDNIIFSAQQIDTESLTAQYELANFIINDNILLPFFQ